MEEYVPARIEKEKVPKEKGSYSWAKLLARIYEVFPLVCTCGEAMKIIAFITNPYLAKHILAHLKFSTNPFDPLPFEKTEPENGSQIPIDTTEWENGSQLVPEIMTQPASKYNLKREYEMSQLNLGTSDGFTDSYDAPLWMDSS
jgi:hypothetical protein